jgi:hypothetical protein
MFLTVYFASGSLCVEGMVVSIDEVGEVIVDAGSDNTGEVWRDPGRLVGLRYDSPGFCWVVGFVFGDRRVSSGIFFIFPALVVVGAVPLGWRVRFWFFAGTASSFQHSCSLGTITGKNKKKILPSLGYDWHGRMHKAE